MNKGLSHEMIIQFSSYCSFFFTKPNLIIQKDQSELYT